MGFLPCNRLAQACRMWVAAAEEERCAVHTDWELRRPRPNVLQITPALVNSALQVGNHGQVASSNLRDLSSSPDNSASRQSTVCGSRHPTCRDRPTKSLATSILHITASPHGPTPATPPPPLHCRQWVLRIGATKSPARFQTSASATRKCPHHSQLVLPQKLEYGL